MTMNSRHTHLQRLADSSAPYDIVIIGGGINGAGIARDASRRGLRVCLVEQADLATGTSSRSSKLVHGGLRYLEQYQFGLVFESVSERRVLMKIAPHLVQPLPFLFPVYRPSKRPMFVVSAGMLMYEALALFRSPGRPRRNSAKLLRTLEPMLSQARLVGAPMYYDCATDDARLTLETALDAADHGATILTYTRALSMERDSEGRVQGVRVRSLQEGTEHEIACRVVANASGPWVDETMNVVASRPRRSLRPTKGCHIVVPHSRLPLRHAVVMQHPHDKRVLFGIPWGDSTYIGTTDTDFKGDPASVFTDGRDVAYLLESTDVYFPDAALTPDDIISTWAGLRPLLGPPEGADVSESAISREHHIDTTDDGVVTVAGGKLTTYRLMCAEVVDAALKWAEKHGRALTVKQAAATGSNPLPGAAGWARQTSFLYIAAQVQGAVPALTGETAMLLARTYGTRAPQVAALAAAEPALAQPIVPGRPEIMAQIRFGVEHELLATVTDAIKQRTQLFYRDADQGLGAVDAVGDYMATLLGWDAAQTAASKQAYRDDVALSRRWKEDVTQAIAERKHQRALPVAVSA
jgi:glycerol-3-phosphate dehydrogenase